MLPGEICGSDVPAKSRFALSIQKGTSRHDLLSGWAYKYAQAQHGSIAVCHVSQEMRESLPQAYNFHVRFHSQVKCISPEKGCLRVAVEAPSRVVFYQGAVARDA